MSLELLVAGVAGGIVGGYFALRGWVARRGRTTRAKASVPDTESALNGELHVGDVVGIGEREYWLTGGYSLREAGTALCEVFSADEVRLVLSLGPEGALYVGHQVRLTLPSELPARLDHRDHSFLLKARFPVAVVPLGPDAKPAESALWGRYEGGDEQTLWVLRTPAGGHGILSRRVPERDVFRWGSAGSP